MTWRPMILKGGFYSVSQGLGAHQVQGHVAKCPTWLGGIYASRGTPKVRAFIELSGRNAGRVG